MIGLGLVGLNNAQALSGAQTDAQRLAVAVAFGSGVLALASAAALWRRASALGALLVVWDLSMAAAAGLAPWAWGSAPTQIWVAAGGVGLALGAAVAVLAWWARVP